jgi:hypothetical protein
MPDKVALRISSTWWRIGIGWSLGDFTWVPGEIESSKSSPAESFNSPSDASWLWGWLGFVVFFARAYNY